MNFVKLTNTTSNRSVQPRTNLTTPFSPSRIGSTPKPTRITPSPPTPVKTTPDAPSKSEVQTNTQSKSKLGTAIVILFLLIGLGISTVYFLSRAFKEQREY